MASGTERRVVATDSLKGAAQVSSAPVPKPQLPQVNAKAEDVVNTPIAKVARSINSFAGKKFQEAANVHNEKNFLDGQIAAAQGQAFEDADFKGNKWAIAGYRATEAETITSTLFASQREMLRQADYQDDPDAYRAKLVNRLEQQIDGLDPFTAQLVRKQFAAHSSTLVAEHTAANLQYQEKQAFDATVNSIDIMSKDDTQVANLLANASGTGGTAGLSIERRQAAVTQGVINAYDNMNPLAFQRLKTAGIIDQLPHEHQQKIKQAEQNYQTRLREQYSAEFEADMTALEQKLATGKYSPEEIANDLAQVYADHGMKVRGTEQKQAHAAAQGATELYERGNAVIYEQAVRAGDFDAILALADEAKVWHESKGDPYALGPVVKHGANAGDRAQGSEQVMPKTMADPGYGIRPSNGTMEDTRRVGKEYFKVMMMGSSGPGNFPWSPGDIEAAAVAYNAGPANAIKWHNAGRDYSVLPDRAQTEPYAKGILARATGATHTQTAEYRLETAQQMAKAAKEQLDMTSYENFALDRAALDEEFQREGSDMTIQEYVAANRELNAAHDVQRTQAMSNHMIGVIESVGEEAKRALAEAEEAAEADQLEMLDTARIQMTEQYKSQMENPDLSMVEKQRLGEKLLDDVTAMYGEAGVPLATWEPSKTVSSITAAYHKAYDAARQQQEDNAVMAYAESTGTVADLSPALRAEYWQSKRESVREGASEEASQRGLPNEEAQALIEEQAKQSWIQAGEVDPSVGKANAAILNGNPLAKDGRPSPAVVSMVQRYQDLKSSNPYISETFFGKDEGARARAEAILKAGAGDAVEGILNLDYEANKSKTPRFNAQLTPDEITAAATVAAVREHAAQEVGWFQDFFESGEGQLHETTTREGRVREEQAREVFAPEVEKELHRLSIRHDLPPSALIDMAVAKVKKRSAFVGESVILYPEGQSLLTNALGPKVAEQYAGKNGIEDEIISQYLRDNPENIPALEGATQFMSGTESNVMLLSGISQAGQQAADLVIDGLPSLFGFDVDLIADPALSVLESRDAQNKGVRPYQVAVDPAGNTYVSYLKTDGERSEFVKMNMKIAGDNWSKNGKSAQTWVPSTLKATRSKYPGGPFAGQ